MIEKMTEKKLRILMAFVGIFMTGICVGVFQFLVLGLDPFTSFVTAFVNIFGVRFSITYMAVIFIMLIAVFLLQKKYIGIATFMNLFLVGIMADATRAVMEFLITSPSMTVRIILMVVNVVLLSFAASLYFTANLGVSAYDAIALMAANDYKITQFRFCRITTDFICVLVGFIFGADIGVGTVITAFCMGPIIQFFNENFSEPLLKSKTKVRHLK